MGDTKKTEIEKKDKTGRYVGFKEVRDDIFNEASKLVSEVPSTRIAIFVTPPSSSNPTDLYIPSLILPSKPLFKLSSMNAEQLEAAQEKLMRLRNHMILHLEAKERGQCSGNIQQDLHNDEDGPKS